VKNRIRNFRLLLVCVLFCAATATGARAENSDRTQVGHDITVAPGEEIGEATCIGCSVRVRGHVSGDVTSIGGSILIEDQGQIDGDATTLGGGIHLAQSAKVTGDVTVLGGRIRRDPSASIDGDVTNFSSPWIVPMILIPLGFIGGVIALIVWVIRRIMRPSLAAA